MRDNLLKGNLWIFVQFGVNYKNLIIWLSNLGVFGYGRSYFHSKNLIPNRRGQYSPSTMVRPLLELLLQTFFNLFCVGQVSSISNIICCPVKYCSVDFRTRFSSRQSNITSLLLLFIFSHQSASFCHSPTQPQLELE